MPAAPRKAVPRKAPAKKVGAAAVAARREVRAEKNPAVTYTVPFRGETFVIKLDRLATEKIWWREKAVQQFPTPEKIAEMLFEIIGPNDSARFIGTMKVGDDLLSAASQFMTAFRKASADPNS